MSFTRLSAQDAAFIYGEDQRIPLHVGGLGLIEAEPLRDDSGAIDIERIRREVQNRLHLVPRFRQKLIEVPLDQARPVWADDNRFDIERHVHHLALPRPGDRRALLELMGRLQTSVLDRTKPLWELYYVEGLAEGDRIALIYKIHHAMIDGSSGMELVKLLYDFAPDAAPLEAQEWKPAPMPSARELLVDATMERVRGGVSATRAFAGALLDPSAPAEQVKKFARAIDTMSGEIPSLPFNAEVSSRRAFATASIDMRQVLDLKRAFGVTVNDIVLSAITGALRDYCDQEGIETSDLERVRVLVPVDNRDPDDKTPGVNVSSMFVDLPIDEPDPHKRVVRIYHRSQRLKGLDVADGANMWAKVTSAMPATMLRAASWFQFRGLMGNANLMVSSVRGPDFPMYSMGGELIEFYPYFGVQDGLGLNITLVSYNGKLLIGLATDPDLLPEPGALAESLPKAFEELATSTLV
jgi:diacylglycerol O-acyltransferase